MTSSNDTLGAHQDQQNKLDDLDQRFKDANQSVKTGGNLNESFKSRAEFERLYQDRFEAAEKLMHMQVEKAGSAGESVAYIIAEYHLSQCQNAYNDYARAASAEGLKNFEELRDRLFTQIQSLEARIEKAETGEFYVLMADLYAGRYANISGVHHESSAKAFHYYRKAASCRKAEGSLRMAQMLRRKPTLDKNNAIYLKLLNQAIRRGSSEAMLNLGCHYFDGDLFDKDYQEAYNLFLDGLAAYENDLDQNIFTLADLKYRIGLCRYYGLGTEKDADTALSMISEAANFDYNAAAFVRQWKKGDLETQWGPCSGTPQLSVKLDKPFLLAPKTSEEISEEKSTKTQDTKPNLDHDSQSPFSKFADKDHKAVIFEEDLKHTGLLPPAIEDFLLEHGIVQVENPAQKIGRDDWGTPAPSSLPDLSDDDIETLLKPLDDMTGLHRVKKEVRNLISLMKARKMREGLGLKTPAVNLHSVFMGPPGTGKTTVARLLGDILHRMGYLAKGHVVEVDHGDLIGEYVGQTGPLTAEKIKQAKGGILFIDEAYMLGHDERFGPEAIATLLKKMEDHRDEFMVIAAGYTGEMKSFLVSNSGFRSRFANIITFDAYSADDLVQIFDHMCAEQSYAPNEGALKRVREILKREKNHGHISISNARGVRDLFEKTIRKQSLRIAQNGAEQDKEFLMEIRAEDIADPEGGRQDNIVFLGDKSKDD